MTPGKLYLGAIPKPIGSPEDNQGMAGQVSEDLSRQRPSELPSTIECKDLVAMSDLISPFFGVLHHQGSDREPYSKDSTCIFGYTHHNYERP